MRSARAATLLMVMLAVAVPAGAQGGSTVPVRPGWLVPPVDGAIARIYLDPLGPYATGHRGIDYAVPTGTLVRAAAGGRVTFAGPVANVRAVSIDHGDGLTTTYTSLASTFVAGGERVEQGRWLGRSGVAHEGGAPGVHFGVKINGEYVDPSAYLGPVGLAGAIHLAPIPSAAPSPTTKVQAALGPVIVRADCRPVARIEDPGPPNENVAVTVAGIATATSGDAWPAIHARVPELLGYPRAATYHFSYVGARGPDLHVAYDRSDTYGDLRIAAERLRELLRRVARRMPGRAVDLIAHSQGGLVARAYLETLHDSWDPRLPVVEHLVTFATPHEGAPLAGSAGSLEDSLPGGALLRWMSRRARAEAPWPDPLSSAVAQMRPESEFMRSLAREDVSYGTRVLALGAANDLVVPADRARLGTELSRTFGPSGLNGHSGIVTGAQSIATAYAFLRGAAKPCWTGWDEWGPRFGRVVGWLEDKIPWAYDRLEDAVLRRLLFGLGSALERKG